MPLSTVRFVLFRPSHPGNIGAAARAIKTMGFSELALVGADSLATEGGRGEARARASGAVDVLENAMMVDTLAEALAGCGLVLGASARTRRMNIPQMNPRQCAAELHKAGRTRPAAVVFGPETAGLTNAELDLCHALVCIPSNPDYSSLNLAMAVQVIAYELSRFGSEDKAVPDTEAPLASSEEMELFYQHLERVLVGSGFLKPHNPRNLMRRLRRLFNRTQLDENEMNILRGILSALVPGSGKPDWKPGPQDFGGDSRSAADLLPPDEQSADT